MKIILDGPPISKARHRSFVKGKFVRSYDPQEKEKKNAKNLLKKQVEVLNLDTGDQFLVTLCFYIPVCQSIKGSKRNACLWGFEIPTRTDLDNLIKFILDVANEILWPDDRMITFLKAEKKYSEKPRTEIEVMTILNLKEESRKEEEKHLITVFSPSELEDFTKQVRYLFHYLCTEDVSQVAKQISEIAEKYADKLTKIKKITSKQQKNKEKIVELKE